ncbi:hypothetical protein ACXPWS_29495 [Mycobacterium sp. BMJ-28]
MSGDVSRRSALRVAGAAAATIGAGMAISSCSQDEDQMTHPDSSLFNAARTPQRDPLPRGKVLIHDTFDGGFDGWRDHYHGTGPAPALSLTSYPVFSGSHALMIGCSAPPDSNYVNGWASGTNAAAFKNLSRYYDSGLITFSCYMAHCTDQSSESLGGFWLMIDTQFWDNSQRSFFVLMVEREDNGNRKIWVMGNDQKQKPVSSDATQFLAGDNENKFNFDWISLTVDLGANGGLGGYHSCQINHRVIDLRKADGQNAHQVPQAGSPMSSFAGGLNFGVLAIPGKPGSGESYVVVDQAVVTVDEAAS